MIPVTASRVSSLSAPSPRFVNAGNTYFNALRSLQRGWLHPDGMLAKSQNEHVDYTNLKNFADRKRACLRINQLAKNDKHRLSHEVFSRGDRCAKRREALTVADPTNLHKHTVDMNKQTKSTSNTHSIVLVFENKRAVLKL
jgi:hypothetical protein